MYILKILVHEFFLPYFDFIDEPSNSCSGEEPKDFRARIFAKWGKVGE
jgi:hypothetical protein